MFKVFLHFLKSSTALSLKSSSLTRSTSTEMKRGGFEDGNNSFELFLEPYFWFCKNLRRIAVFNFSKHWVAARPIPRVDLPLQYLLFASLDQRVDPHV